MFYLPGLCTYTETEGKLKKARVGYILRYSKNTIFNEHLVGKIKASPDARYLITAVAWGAGEQRAATLPRGGGQGQGKITAARSELR